MIQSSAVRSSAVGCHPRRGLLPERLEMMQQSGVLVGRIFTCISAQAVRVMDGLFSVVDLIASIIVMVPSFTLKA